DYITLKVAFDAVNAGTITGNIELKVIDNTTETASAVLNASGTGSANYTAISIYPTVTGKTISGNLASAMIQLVGADNVSIDGRLNRTGSTVNLTINNTNVGGSSISLTEGATTNTIQYNTLKSSGTAITTATLYLGTSTITGGNSNNTVAYNNFTGSTSRCMTAIGSVGSAAPNDNVSNTINNNLFYDMMSFPDNVVVAFGYAAIRIGNNNSTWDITNNRFYETTEVPVAMNFNYTVRASFININTGATGGLFTVSNNFFGGNAADGTGILRKAAGTFSSNFVDFDAIYIKNSTNINLASSVQGNIFTNINMLNCFGGSFNCMNIAGGAVNVGNITGNIIGSATQKAALQLTHGSCMVDATADAGTLRGFFITADIATINISNNTIAGLYAAQSTQGAKASISGIEIFNLAAVTGPTVTIQNNTIGADMDSSLVVRAARSGYIRGIFAGSKCITHVRNNTIQKMYASDISGGPIAGIYSFDGTMWIRNNVIKNIESYGSTGGDLIVYGIKLSADGGISGNTISNITCNATTGGTTGIFSGSSNITDTGGVKNNFIYDLNVNPTSLAVYGIIGIDAVNNVNNVVVIDQDNKTPNIGIQSTGMTVNNTVYVTGTQLGFANAGNGRLTTAFSGWRTNGGSKIDIRNNHFVNTRVNAAGVVAKHYAVGLYDPTGTRNYIIDYNVYYSADSVFGFQSSNTSPNASSDKRTLASWQAFTLQDCHSYNENPGYANPSVVSLVSSYLPSNTGLSGYPFVNLTKDYYGNTRGNTAVAPMATGAIEYVTTPRPGYTAPYIRSISKVNRVDSATITVTGTNIGLITTVPFATPAYYFYYVNFPITAQYKVTNITVLSDTSFKFDVPQLYNFDVAKLFNLTVRMCGTATYGYNYSGISDVFTVNNLTPMPVSYLSFEAKQNAQQVLLNWATAQEQNSEIFIVEYSLNGQEWKSIGSVKAAGNSASINNYRFLHADPKSGNNFYRLVQVDKDGSKQISKVVVVNYSTRSEAFRLLNNPVDNGIIRFELKNAETVSIYSADGKLLRQMLYPAGIQQATARFLQPGMYIIRAGAISQNMIVK
ncbi:MAG: beta strand repeat-containing protein, partial [Ferruginibacter sp.]